MDDRESALEKNPYLRTIFRNPPLPAVRPIATNRDPNPYHPHQGPRHLRPTSRLGTYSLCPEAPSNMVAYNQQKNSSLISAALGSSQITKFHFQAGAPDSSRRALNAGYPNDEPIARPSKSSKRKYEAEEASSDLSEHDDEDFSPDTRRRLAPTPNKQRKRQLDSRQHRLPHYLSTETYDEEMVDDNEVVDKDAEEEEALMRAIAEQNARRNSSSLTKTPATKRRKQQSPRTPMDSVKNFNALGQTDSSLHRKPRGTPVPQDLNSASAADRMMWRWKSQGRPWEEIRDEYQRISGTRPAASSLSVRYIKLNENLAANGFRDEAAILKAVAEAKIKQARPFWKEVVTQMKIITQQDFAGPSLRKKYEEIKANQFFVGEQNPRKYSQWPPLPEDRRARANLYRDIPDVAPNGTVTDFDSTPNHQTRSHHKTSKNTSEDFMFTDQTMHNVEYLGNADSTKREPTSLFFHDYSSEAQGKVTTDLTRYSAYGDENESPAHTHPHLDNGHVKFSKEVTPDRSMLINVGPSSPTPGIANGAVATDTGRHGGMSIGPVENLVGYGDSDESD